MNNNLLEKVIILNPDYHLKNDLDRILIFSQKDVSPYSSPKWFSFLHPIQAYILRLFSTVRPFEKQIELLSEKFHITNEKAKNIISPYIENSEIVCTEFSGNSIPFPKNVLININKINSNTLSYDIDLEEFGSKNIDLKQDRMHKAPHSILFILNTKCVTSCKYCYADKRTKYEELDTQRILQLIAEAKSLKINNIDIIGGEVFCKKDWHIILKELVDSQLTPEYISTKYPMSSEIIKKLYHTGYNNVVQISLDSMNETNLSEIIGVKSGYLIKMKNCIDKLQQYNFKLQINTILTKHNVNKKEIKDLYEYAKTIKNLIYWEIRIPGESIYTRRTFHDVKANKEALYKIISYIENDIIPNSPIKIIVSKEELYDNFRKGKGTDTCFDTGHCSALYNQMFVLPDGKVTLCERLYWHPKFIIGDLRTQSIAEVWRSEKAKSMFIWQKDFYENSQSLCNKCNIFYFCHNNHRKCWYRILRTYGTRHWDYPDPQCEFAPEKGNICDL